LLEAFSLLDALRAGGDGGGPPCLYLRVYAPSGDYPQSLTEKGA
jgi:hypothetical protein